MCVCVCVGGGGGGGGCISKTMDKIAIIFILLVEMLQYSYRAAKGA